VAFETVKWRETFNTEANAAAFDPERDDSRGRYDLATAMRIVRRMETSAARGAVFAEIKRKNPLYQFVDWLYSKAGANTLQPLALFAYMLKCVVSLGRFDDNGFKAVAITNFENERHTIERLTALVPEVPVKQLSPSRRHMVARGQFRAALSLVRAAPRLWPFLSRLARSYSFMPSARIASGLAYYIRFSQLFAEHAELEAAIVASNYSPEALGVAAAAHRRGRRVIYANHAPVPANGTFVPPVLADCAVLYGDAVRQTYEQHSRCTAEVILIGQPGTAQPMEWRDEVRTVGIFLTALTRADAVADLVAAISASLPGARILVRNHPVALLKADFADLVARYENLEVTIGNRLEDEIAACDLIFCGNSGVTMNVLRGGRPVAYFAALDELHFDYNGFVERGLACNVAGWSEDLYLRLKLFYTNPGWRRIMQSYDASYGTDKAALEAAAGETIRRYLRPTPAQDSRGSLARLPVPPSFRAAS
jgi:hypothetical protein